MIRKNVLFWLKENLNQTIWQKIWWLLPVSAIFLLPIGAIVLQGLLRLGLDEAPRLTQLLMLFSIFYGPICGMLILLSIDFTEFPFSKKTKIKWLARLSVVFPILTLLSLFLFYSHR
jgi:hypothetical protein